MDLVLQILIVGFLAGTLGSMVGLGGGVLMVPLLTLVFHIPIHTAIGASIVGVVATSTTSASTFLKNHLSNIKVGITMDTCTAIGAIIGGLTAAMLNRQALSAIFAVALVATSITMFKKVNENRNKEEDEDKEDTGRFGGVYYDAHLQKEVSYNVKRIRFGLLMALIGGNLSGLLGIGGGVINVPTMVLAMGVPMRAAVATSNFMIGVTAIASAYIYYTRGFIDLLIAAPAAIGVFLGAKLGANLAGKVKSDILGKILTVVMVILAAQMALAAFGIEIR